MTRPTTDDRRFEIIDLNEGVLIRTVSAARLSRRVWSAADLAKVDRLRRNGHIDFLDRGVRVARTR